MPKASNVAAARGLRGFGGATKGKGQTIAFPPVGNLKADSGPVKLKATSDSGLPVEYYVACGPARIEDGALRIEIRGLDMNFRSSETRFLSPEFRKFPRAKYPIEVRWWRRLSACVVAYQFGRAIAPLVKTAAPVAHTIRIEKPLQTSDVAPRTWRLSVVSRTTSP